MAMVIVVISPAAYSLIICGRNAWEMVVVRPDIELETVVPMDAAALATTPKKILRIIGWPWLLAMTHILPYRSRPANLSISRMVERSRKMVKRHSGK